LEIVKLNKIININKEDCNTWAAELFKQNSGLFKEGNIYNKMRKDAKAIRNIIDEKINAQVVFSYFDEITLNEEEATIGGEKIKCKAFGKISPKSIKGALVYILTVGEYCVKDESVIDQLYADLWGTSFTDAARYTFKKIIEKDKKLSDGFGPGFYGMNMTEMQKIASLVDSKKIGVEIKENGMLVPAKSCAGIYFEINDNYKGMDVACKTCLGNQLSCQLCHVNKETNKMFKCTGICSKCGRCKGLEIVDGANGRKTKLLKFPYDFVPEKEAFGFGMAFDIGTTTVVGTLWDLKKAIEIGSIAKTNPQSKYGADVISRIAFVREDKKKFNLLKDGIINCLNLIIEELCEKNQLKQEDIIKVTVVGNTTMSHIFAGYDPTSLAFVPFRPAYKGEIVQKAIFSNLNINPEGDVIIFPNIAGHVGGDITAGIIASRILEEKKLTVFIDIGTNGEIVISNNGKVLTCSVAAGPAFEGAAIYQGMRAAPGAIEKVKIKEKGDVLFKTIEGIEPVGICGSGLIDAISEMVRVGAIDKNGRLLSAADIREKKLDRGLEKRLTGEDSKRQFVLVFKELGDDIVITQKDIRQVQLAKGAIAAGINIILDKLEEKAENINKVFIAGAFGNFIDKESAVNIGILPKIDLKKIHSIGNTALIGALMALTSAKEISRVMEVPAKVQHIELSTCCEFQTEYLKAMEF